MKLSMKNRVNNLYEDRDSSIRYFPKIIFREDDPGSMHMKGDWEVFGKMNSIYSYNYIAAGITNPSGKEIETRKHFKDNSIEFLRKYGYTTRRAAWNSLKDWMDDKCDKEVIEINLDDLDENDFAMESYKSRSTNRRLREDFDRDEMLHDLSDLIDSFIDRWSRAR